ncbi:gamma-glutamyltransferase [Nocardioides sp.]|uniref:gamma-glutamyltransferase n=1 Tax=Nocardioides sp. TaxID=35761 RepID=UPI002D7EFEF6|nr:gamma-glutamyltransferase [Nocardioides sp.]HET8959029.1 gamma-glutamyltransferase [Nocardioides sp.]
MPSIAREAARLGVATSAVLAVTIAAPAQTASAGADPAPARTQVQTAAEPPKVPTATGSGGAVSSVDPYATRIGLDVLRAGGNATDAAVATAAALGVTEPYSAGIGGGGFFVHYDADTGRVQTIDGRETAPMGMPEDAFVDPATGQPYSFSDQVSSGVSVGVPGTLATWQRALDRWGTRNLSSSVRPAANLAHEGFVVDQTFHDQTAANQERFSQFTSTRELFLPGGSPPPVGSTFRNPDLAETYELIARRGPGAFYRGALSPEIVRTVQHPPTTRDATLPAPAGYLKRSDLTGYRVLDRAPTRSGYRGYDVFGMRSSSSGGTTVGEALNIMERYDLASMSDQDALHRYLEAGALAFADRGKYFGDEAFVDVPVRDLLSDTYAAERACRIQPTQAQAKPVPAGNVDDYDGRCSTPNTGSTRDGDTEGLSTTNLTVTDRWGDVVEYTLTIEQTGGAGIVVPDRGFLLNNELTDFTTTVYPVPESDPNRPEPGKRPRSSMSPTIVLDDGEPFVALGSPGGSTIITTVLQMLFNRIDRGMDLEQAMAAPRSSPRNTSSVVSEPAFISAYGTLLGAYGHQFASTPEIGAATAIEFGPGGSVTAVAEPTRRGGGSAAVVEPAP